MITQIVATYMTPPSIRGRSRALIASSKSLPIPGSEKIDSIRIEPVKISPSCVPAIVMIGIKAFLKPCPKITDHLFRPFASAVRM